MTEILSTIAIIPLCEAFFCENCQCFVNVETASPCPACGAAASSLERADTWVVPAYKPRVAQVEAVEHRFDKKAQCCTCGWKSSPTSNYHWELQWQMHLEDSR
jgi:hypothetical protein